MSPMRSVASALVVLALGTVAHAQDNVVGLIPKATAAVQLDGKLDEWAGAFATPVHVGHPDLANRGAEFLYLWDDDNLYIGLRCLDQKPAHVGRDNEIYNGDAVEFYLDARRGDKLGAKEFSAGALHMFYTPFTGTEIKPRLAVRNLPVFKGFRLQGAEVAASRTLTGWTCEFKLPWKHFPDFRPKAGEVIGIDCELCSSDGGPRVDRTFVYSSPASVGTPATFGRVRLVDKIDPADLMACSRAVLPTALTRSANYAGLYGTVGVPSTLADQVATVEGKVLDADGKARKETKGAPKDAAPLRVWAGAWELFDLPAGAYTVEVVAFDKSGRPLARRRVPFTHGEPNRP